MRRCPLPALCRLTALVCALAFCTVTAVAQSPDPLRRVNAPYFAGNIRYAETAILWFGRVDATHNSVDVRVGYSDQLLYVNLAAFDRYLWYDATQSGAGLTAWDAATVYLDLNHDGGTAPQADDSRFVGQLAWWEKRQQYQAAYLGDGADWAPTTVPFTTTSGWRGNAPNDSLDDRGWWLSLEIPFESLGLTGPPPQGTVWGLGLALHDRDDVVGTPIQDTVWPEGMSPSQPDTWGDLAFGLPSYRPPFAVARGVTTIRQGLGGAPVPDGAVGGTIDNLCPGDPQVIWYEWGDANFAGAEGFNVQNQADVADWPCFARYYVTFPLDALPSGKVIISATLTLHEWGGSDPSQAYASLIQVLTVGDDWDEATLTWNNGPLALENVARAWVDPLPGFPGWPGVPWTWDVSGAAATAYASGTPLRLALYEADSAYHSGKYFVASDVADWNAAARPTLRVGWGDAAEATHAYLPLVTRDDG